MAYQGKRPNKFTVHRRFLKLRACWTILTGGSVAWMLDIDGRIEALSRHAFYACCKAKGKDLRPEHIWWSTPDPQPDVPQ